MEKITKEDVRKSFMKYAMDYEYEGNEDYTSKRKNTFILIHQCVDKKAKFIGHVEYDMNTQTLTACLLHEMGTWKWEEHITLIRMDSYLKSMDICDWYTYLKYTIKKRFNTGIQIDFKVYKGGM